MSRRCAYSGCFYAGSSLGPLSIFKSPNKANQELFNVWVRHSNDPNNQEKKSFFVCEKHFNKCDLLVYGTFKKLKEESVPLPAKNSICCCRDGLTDMCCSVTTKENRLKLEEHCEMNDIGIIKCSQSNLKNLPITVISINLQFEIIKS